MRFNVILLANGVQRIFYHAGTCPGLNAENTEGTFFEYGGTPRKIYAALAAFAELFPPGCKPLGELDWGQGVKAYQFEVAGDAIVAAWQLPGGPPARVLWDAPEIEARDIMGNAMGGHSANLCDAPVFIVGHGMMPGAVANALQCNRG
jgi:hypothetical protein